MTRQSLTQAGNSSVDTGKRIDFLILVAVLLLLSLSTCAEPNDPQEDDNGPTIPSIDDSSNISIITWNIEHFPQAGSVTIARVQLLLDSLDADIYCLQEIDNPVSLTSIIDKLEKYEVVHSPGDSYVRSTVYKPDVVHLVSSSEFLNTYGYEFAWRPPFISEFEFEKDGRKQSLNVINVHLKAFGDPLGDQLLDRLVGILHKGLREKRAFLEELLQTPLDDLCRNLLGLSFFFRLLHVDPSLALDHIARNLIRGDRKRIRGGDVHRDVFRERLEVIGVRYEVRFAVHFNDDGSPIIEVNIAADRPFVRGLLGTLRCLRRSLRSQEIDRFINVPLGLGEGLLAIHHPRAGHVTELLYVCCADHRRFTHCGRALS